MSFRALLLTLMLMVYGCSGCVLSDIKTGSPDVPYDALQHNIVHVYSHSGPGTLVSRGSGVVMSTTGLDGASSEFVGVLSAWHIFWNESKKSKSGISIDTRVMISPIDEPLEEPEWVEAVEARIACFDARWDLALLITKRDWIEQRFSVQPPGAKLRLDNPQVGERVYSISNSSIYHRACSEGVVSTYHEECKTCVHPQSLVTDTSSWKGGSGGALFSEDGNLCGILTRTGFQGRWSLHVPPEAINSFLDRCSIAMGEQGMKLAEVTEFQSSEHFILGSPRSVVPKEEKVEMSEVFNTPAFKGACRDHAQGVAEHCEDAKCGNKLLEKYSPKELHAIVKFGNCVHQWCRDAASDGPEKFTECALEWCADEIKGCEATSQN